VRWCIIARAENLFQPRDKVLAYSRWVLPCCTACARVCQLPASAITAYGEQAVTKWIDVTALACAEIRHAKISSPAHRCCDGFRRGLEISVTHFHGFDCDACLNEPAALLIRAMLPWVVALLQMLTKVRQLRFRKRALGGKQASHGRVAERRQELVRGRHRWRARLLTVIGRIFLARLIVKTWRSVTNLAFRDFNLKDVCRLISLWTRLDLRCTCHAAPREAGRLRGKDDRAQRNPLDSDSTSTTPRHGAPRVGSTDSDSV
jgi:hypothetical protein